MWTFPECPVRIHVNFRFIERLRAEVLDLAPADCEVGGLLIGNELSPGGDIEISDYFRLPPSSELAKNFIVCTDSLTRAIQSWSAGHRRVIGFYRTHLEQRLHLRAEDQECIRSKFNDPTNVFLILRPHDGAVSAGFYFWQDGSVVGGLAFPFETTELKGPTWTTLVGGSPQENGLASLGVRARAKAMWASKSLRIRLLLAVTILIALTGALRIYRANSNKSPALGLRVERALLGVVVAWNPANREIASAKDANLLIWDGSSPPAFVRLTNAQLHAGRAFFTSVSDRVEVRMDVIGASGTARTESIVSVSHAPDLGSSELPATVTNTVVPLRQASLPSAAKTSEDRPTKEAGKEAGTVARIFIPAAPGAKASGPLPELLQPPELQSAEGGLTALTPTFHTLTNQQTVVPRYAPDPPPAAVREVAAQQPPPAEARAVPVQQPPPAAVRDVPVQPPSPVTKPEQTAPVVAQRPAPGFFQPAVPIRETRPDIPPQLKPLVQSDNVIQVLVQISASGTVTAAKLGATKGPVAGFLSKLALNAALTWQFRPATQNGEPVPSEKTLEFQFRASGR